MNSLLNSLSTVHPSELARRGEEIYQRVASQLETEHRGEFLAIEVESGQYFLGKTQIEATDLAKKKFPSKVFYLIKVGYPAVITVSSHFKPPSYGDIL